MYQNDQLEMSKMKNLEDYFGKRVKIVDDNGKEWHGRVIDYTSALDNETDGIVEESIVIKTDDKDEDKRYIEFMQHEVKSIEVEK